MKYQSAKLKQMLAAEYVLGTLRGAARARFERLRMMNATINTEVHYWEKRLAALARVQPQAPREIVWAGIDRAINASTVTVAKPARTNLWRAWSLIATAASVLLGVMLVQQMQVSLQFVPVPKIVLVERPMPYVALLQPAQSDAKWLISMYPERGTMKVAASGRYAMDQRHSLELWVLEKAGPRPLGLLPMQGQMDMPLKDMPVQGEVTLAVSIEPPGGSPTGLPTGPVILSAPASRAL